MLLVHVRREICLVILVALLESRFEHHVINRLTHELGANSVHFQQHQLERVLDDDALTSLAVAQNYGSSLVGLGVYEPNDLRDARLGEAMDLAF